MRAILEMNHKFRIQNLGCLSINSQIDISMSIVDLTGSFVSVNGCEEHKAMN